MTKKADPVMNKAIAIFEASGLSLEELGQKMGYAPDKARRSAWQFLRRTRDPRLSMLRRFAAAIGASLRELVEE
jgi:transcriptional regulator with XRE-family HTH domain